MGNRIMEGPAPRARIGIGDTEDVLALVPYLLGYRPEERVVLVAVQDGRVALSAALDIDSLLDEPGSDDLLGQAVEQLVDVSVFAVAWSSDDCRAERALALLTVRWQSDQLIDVAVVGPDRWHAVGPFPRGGRTSELAARPVVAQAVLAGLQVIGSRDDVVALVAGPEDDPALCDRFLAAESRCRRLRGASAQRRAVALQAALLAGADALAGPAGGAGPDVDQDLAHLAVLARDERVARALWLALDEGCAEPAERLWLQVVARTPRPWAAGALGTCGFAGWLNGNGVLLVSCLERLWALGERTPVVAVLDAFNRLSLPPQAWRDLGTGRAGWWPAR